MKDTYENRALFLIMWCGAPHLQTREMFPKWSAERMGIKSGSVDETLWLLDFSRGALRLKAEECA